MKIAVLGGAGAMGRVAVRDLEENIPEVDEILLADINRQAAEDYVRSIGAKKVTIKELDIKNREELVREIKTCDAVLNACLYDTVAYVAEACIDAGVPCTDFGGQYYYVLKQLELDQRAKDVGVTIMPGCGSAPGITSVMCGMVAKQMDEIDELAVKFAGVLVGGTFRRRLPLPWAVESLINEFEWEPIVYENGEWKKLPPASGRGPVEFMPPIGTNIGYYSIHSEIATVPRFLKPRKFYVQGAFAEVLDSAMRRLIDLGFTSTTPIQVKGVSVVPRDVTAHILTNPPPEPEAKPGTFHSGIKVEAVGKSKGKKMRLEYESQGSSPMGKWGIGPTALRTGVAGSIGAWMLARGEIKVKGVAPPEVAVDSEKFISELKKRDIIVYEKKISEM